jgi:hypothetical protein
MSPSQPTCTHDRGRGTTVCLRCRHEQAQASQRRRQKFHIQFLGAGAVVAIVGIAGVGAASTLRGGDSSAVTTSEGAVTAPSQTPATVTAPIVQQQATTPAPVVDSTPTPPPAPVVRPAPRGGFVLVEGRTKLVDSVQATRTGDSVIVNFDAFGFRTRRSSKIEQTLRLTLPLVFGRSATASLDGVATGQLVANRDVIGELATEGMLLTLDNGAAVRIRILTRVVSDGPIAIGYLATLER